MGEQLRPAVSWEGRLGLEGLVFVLLFFKYLLHWSWGSPLQSTSFPIPLTSPST